MDELIELGYVIEETRGASHGVVGDPSGSSTR